MEKTIHERVLLINKAQESLDEAGGDYMIISYSDDGLSAFRYKGGMQPHRLVGLANLAKLDVEMEACMMLTEARQNAVAMRTAQESSQEEKPN